MKALSLKQPFAELVVSGKKSIEIRKWSTKFRGEFLVHASKIPDKLAMKKHGFEELPTGVIVGKATLVDVKHYESSTEFKKDQNKHLASSDFGDYGFILKNIKRLPKVPAKGQLGFWNFSVKYKNKSI